LKPLGAGHLSCPAHFRLLLIWELLAHVLCGLEPNSILILLRRFKEYFEKKSTALQHLLAFSEGEGG